MSFIVFLRCSLSSSVLQGFTCTGVGLFGKGQINKLVKACRRKGTKKVSLKETQVRHLRVCMDLYGLTNSYSKK